MQRKTYAQFWQNAHSRARQNHCPLRVMFELTYRCNFSCRHCYVPLSYRKKPELKTKEVFFILDELAKAGCLYLGFTGGEPFMRRDILKILRYARRKGFVVIIYTNGSLITEKIAKVLAELGINKVDITIPAITEDVFEKITGAKGAYKKVFRAISLLRKNKVPLGFKTCVLKENQGQIEKIRDFAQKQGAFYRLDDMLSRRLDGSSGPYLYRGVLKDALIGNKICPE